MAFTVCFRLCAALTWPTAAHQGLFVTWQRSCVRSRASHGWIYPWWRRRSERNQAPLFCLPFRILATAQLNKPVWLSIAITITSVLMAQPVADTQISAGTVVLTLLWVLLHTPLCNGTHDGDEIYLTWGGFICKREEEIRNCFDKHSLKFKSQVMVTPNMD